MSLDRQARQNEQAREHVKRTRERLANGRAELQRLHESIESTNRHIASISEWIDEAKRSLAEAGVPDEDDE